MSHQIHKRDVQNVIVGQEIAGVHGREGNKSLMFSYDIGRKRLQYVVVVLNDGRREYAYDTLDEAIEAYNDV